ncbi:MAG: hypothetical protein WCK63_10795 [Betaproteobacteria bacterium]
MLSIVAGLLLVLAVLEGVFFFQKNKTMGKELVLLKKELKEKTVEHDNLQEQIESLSRQFASLKEFSVARSGDVHGKKTEAPTPVAETKSGLSLPAAKGSQPPIPAPVSEAKPLGKENKAPVAVAPPVPPQPTIPAKLERPKPEGQGCELMGKSAEEQAAILKRCVGVMDMSKDKPGGK